MRRLHQRFIVSDWSSEALVTRFSPDSSLLAAGCADGHVKVFHPRTASCLYTLPSAGEALPITALRWRGGGSTKTKNVLIAASADGSIRHWHVTSQKVLSKVQAPDQVYCLDARADGEQYATAGKDKAVRLHDDGTGAVVVTCRPGGYETIGHSNRIFGVKYHPNDPTRLVSGGWDNTVIFWDARTGASTASVFGPHVCGDSVDLYDNLLLTGSWRPEKQLQLWDIRYVRRNEPVCDIPWSAVPAGSGSSAALATRMASRGAPALLYAAQFSASGSYIAAGGSGSNEAKVFDNTGTLVQSSAIPEPTADPSTPSLAPPTLCGTIAGLSRSVYSVSFDGDSAVAVAGGDFLLVFDVSPLAGAAAGAGGPSAYSAEKDDVSDAHVVASARGDGDAASADAVSRLRLSKAEEAMLEAAYGGPEEDDDADEGVLDRDATHPGARFGLGPHR